MKRVLCTIQGCPESIMGVKYTQTPLGMLSEPVSNEEADRLCTINGYEPYVNVDDAKALAEEARLKAVAALSEADAAAQVVKDLQAEEASKGAALVSGVQGEQARDEVVGGNATIDKAPSAKGDEAPAKVSKEKNGEKSAK